MITLTLGTAPFPFDRAIQWLEVLLEKGHITEPVYVQYGATDISRIISHPLVSGESIVSFDRLTEITQESRLIISHAGQGSTRNFAARQLCFVILPRLARYREHVDDHQLLFAKSVAQFGVTCCVTYEELEQAVLSPPEPFQGQLITGPKLANHLLEIYPGKGEDLPLVRGNGLFSLSEKPQLSHSQEI